MRHDLCDDWKIPVLSYRTIVIGSGCAGFNAADCLYDMGERDVAILTEGVRCGTSRNTGSDKQTYYKLSLASDGLDSVKEMAQTLFGGGGVNGDHALAEAAGSVRAFMKLVLLGVPFPTNEYGEYVGYKTDHDPRQRATSAGPLTSKYMTECLERSVRAKGVPIIDGMQAVRLLVDNGEIQGVLALDLTGLDDPYYGIRLFRCANIILATGGPAGIYYHSVYPESQTGASGLALEAGASGANLHQWQYGLASTKFRWNVSGTYQQVLPRYISVDAQGNSREFLPDYFATPVEALDMVFLKGYQWPFDVNKAAGSSMIDLIIHHEIYEKNNRVYMDFTRDPAGLENGFAGLSGEAYKYLARSEALLERPINRLNRMNPKAIELYRTHGIDLYSEALEVSICAQHHNGGIAVDGDWQSSVKGLFVVGEAAGTFGAYRPGGSALNSTQVGSLRAAEHISYSQEQRMPDEQELVRLGKAHARELAQIFGELLERSNGESNVAYKREFMQKSMSQFAAHMRTAERIREYSDYLSGQMKEFYRNQQLKNRTDIPRMMKNRDLLVTQLAVLHAMMTAAEMSGSCGSGLIVDKSGVDLANRQFKMKYRPERENMRPFVLYTGYTKNGWSSKYQPVRPIPQPDDWFETVWNNYRKKRRHVPPDSDQ